MNERCPCVAAMIVHAVVIKEDTPSNAAGLLKLLLSMRLTE